jgi:hypothetical protein
VGPREAPTCTTITPPTPSHSIVWRVPERLWRWLTSSGAFWAFAVALVLYNTLGVIFLDAWGGFDFWEHLAAIGAFARRPLHPIDPYALGTGSSHLFTPFHLLWGLVAAHTGASAYAIAPWVAAVNTVLFVVGLRLMAARLVGSASYATPLGMAMLFLWIRPYGWSGFHSFALLPLTAIYPFWLALALCMMVLGVVDEAAPQRSVKILLLPAIVAIVFLVHPLSGSFLVLVLAVRAISQPSLPITARLARIAAPAVGVLLSLAWPFFPVGTAIANAPHYGEQSFAGKWWAFYDTFPVRLLPSFLSLFYFLPLWRRRSADWLSWALIASAALYLLNPVTLRSAFLARYVIYVALVLQWGVVRWLQYARATVATLRRAVGLFLLVLAGAGALEVRSSLDWLAIRSAGRSPTGDRGNRDYVRRFRSYAPFLSSSDVLMADMNESWIVPAVLNCRVVGVRHSNPFMHDYQARRVAVTRFFDPRASAVERDSILTSYRVSRVLVPRRIASSLAGLDELSTAVSGDDYYELRAVRSRSSSSGSGGPGPETPRQR